MINQELINLLERVSFLLSTFLNNYKNNNDESSSSANFENSRQNSFEDNSELLQENCNGIIVENLPNRKEVVNELHDDEVNEVHDRERLLKYLCYIRSNTILTPDMFQDSYEHTAIESIQNFYKEYIKDFVNVREDRRKKVPLRGTDLRKKKDEIAKNVRKRYHPYDNPYVRHSWELTWEKLKTK
jgi:hypothetical protein